MRLCCAFKIRTEDWISKLLALSVLLRAFVPVYAFAGPRGSYTYIWAGVILPRTVGSSKAKIHTSFLIYNHKAKAHKIFINDCFRRGRRHACKGIERRGEMCECIIWSKWKVIHALGVREIVFGKVETSIRYEEASIDSTSCFPLPFWFSSPDEFYVIACCHQKAWEGVPKKGSLCHLHSFTWNKR